MNPAVDEGVLELARLGRLNATSCLVDGPVFAQDADALRQAGLQAGLHLNFTEFFPGTAYVHPLGALIRRAYLRRLDTACVQAEIVRQLDRFEAVMQQAPHFVDGHQHVHQLPQIRGALLAELARRYTATPVPWLRQTRAAAQPGIPFSHRFKAAVIQGLGAAELTRCAAGRYPMNRRLSGVYDFQGGKSAYAGLLPHWLSGLQEGDLLMCHPAGHIMRDDPMGEQRHAEYQVLSSPETAQHLARLGLSL